MSFVHLHVHTHYSLLDGFSAVDKLIARTKEMNMPAIAITDHGTMYGVVEFFRVATDAEIKPIIGVEAYVAPQGMHSRDPQLDKRPAHVILLAENEIGYKNLLKICSAAQLEGFYYHPRTDHDYLAQHAEGLICSSACLKGEIPAKILERGPEYAIPILDYYFEVFGRDHFFLELQQHAIPELTVVNQALREFGKRYNARYIATNDVHYVDPQDFRYQDVLLALQTGQPLTEPNRMRMSDNSYYLRSPREMSDLFPDVPEAITNTLEIAERCKLNLEKAQYHLPQFEVPASQTTASYLRQLCESGIIQRYGSHANDPQIRERLEFELSVIHDMGFEPYFLIVWDICRFARDQKIWYNARGSAGGSIVAYVLGISLVEPIEHSLMFERFLNPDRHNMPDIDLDFQEDRRNEIMLYSAQKYGEDRVSQIITFNTMGTKAAIRDVARVMTVPLNEVNRVTKMISTISGKTDSIPETLEKNPAFREVYEQVDYMHEVIDIASQMEGVARSAGTHAAGVVIADMPLIELVPLHRCTNESENNPIKQVCQYEMNMLDYVGLMKVDFLGLDTLTIMQNACALIKERHGVNLNLGNIPTDDPATFQFLGEGHTAGVFQLEGAGMTRFLVQMKPTHLRHIIAMVALYRPGPIEYIPAYINRMQGKQPIQYAHPSLEPIFQETYGVAVYQEQIMQAAMELAGYRASDADELRQAISKKQADKLISHKKQFVDGAAAHGISSEDAVNIFEQWEAFARYGFNKSHAADYGVLAVQTAYLKAHYPLEYMVSLLSNKMDMTEKVAHYSNDCNQMGIEILPPDINQSGWNFQIEERGNQPPAIRFGLGAVKNVSRNSVDLITSVRADGLFKDINDFVHRVDLRKVGRRTFDGLIRVGALDSLAQRRALYNAMEQIISINESHFRAYDGGQMTFFGHASGFNEEISLSEFRVTDPREQLEWERELLGVYLSGHPLTPYQSKIQKKITHYSGDLREAEHKQKVCIAGMVRRFRKIINKRGEPMGFATLEDIQGQVEVVIFSDVWADCEKYIQTDEVLIIRGSASVEEDTVKVIAKKVGRISLTLSDTTNSLSEERESSLEENSENEPIWQEETMDVDLEPYPESDSTSHERHISETPEVHLTTGATPEMIQPAQQESNPATEPSATTVAVEEIAVEGESTATLDYLIQSAPEQNPLPGRLLRVTLCSCGRKNEDRQRLRRLIEMLSSQPGPDHFTLVCVENDHRYLLDFPNNSTKIDDRLLIQLGLIVGKENVAISDSQ